MTHKIINNISIKIHDKKAGKKRKYKKRNVRTHQNAPYSNVASLITNRPQQLDLSTASNREKENIISNAINTVKRDKEILSIMDKPDKEPEILKIKDKEPEMIFESPKPPPIELTQRKSTYFLPKAREKTLYVYPTAATDKTEPIVEDLGVVNKKGRPMAAQKTNESSEQYIERIKKGTGYQNINPKITEISAVKNIVDKIDNKKNKAQFPINPPMTFSPIKTRKQREKEEKENQKITDMFNNNEYLQKNRNSFK
jgi:hypothetical protein